MIGLDGKLAVVTGASRGIGLAVAGALEGGGAHVVRLARSIESKEGRGRTDIRCDVSQPEDVSRAAAVILDRGVPDIVVNNAGMFFTKPLQEIQPAEFAALLSVNVTGCFLVARALLPAMIEEAKGHLVSIGSISDYRTFPGNSAYAASKWGLRALHGVIAAEVAGSPIRTTLVSPGPVDTELWDEIDPDSREGWTKRADMLKAEDVADAVVYAVTRPSRVDVTEIRLLPAGYKPRN